MTIQIFNKGCFTCSTETLKKVEDFECNNTSYISEKEQKLERTITSLRYNLASMNITALHYSQFIKTYYILPLCLYI